MEADGASEPLRVVILEDVQRCGSHLRAMQKRSAALHMFARHSRLSTHKVPEQGSEAVKRASTAPQHTAYLGIPGPKQVAASKKVRPLNTAIPHNATTSMQGLQPGESQCHRAEACSAGAAVQHTFSEGAFFSVYPSKSMSQVIRPLPASAGAVLSARTGGNAQREVSRSASDKSQVGVQRPMLPLQTDS